MRAVACQWAEAASAARDVRSASATPARSSSRMPKRSSRSNAPCAVENLGSGEGRKVEKHKLLEKTSNAKSLSTAAKETASETVKLKHTAAKIARTGLHKCIHCFFNSVPSDISRLRHSISFLHNFIIWVK